MAASGFAREARRRPDLDLLLGPLEAAALDNDGAHPDGTALEDIELNDAAELPTWREDG